MQANIWDAGPTLNQHWINGQCLRECPPAQQKHFYNIYTTSAQRLRHWSNIVSSHTNVLCLLGVNTSFGLGCFDIPAIIQLVCLQANDQIGARAKGFELLTHRCRSTCF